MSCSSVPPAPFVGSSASTSARKKSFIFFETVRLRSFVSLLPPSSLPVSATLGGAAETTAAAGGASAVTASNSSSDKSGDTASAARIFVTDFIIRTSPCVRSPRRTSSEWMNASTSVAASPELRPSRNVARTASSILCSIICSIACANFICDIFFLLPVSSCFFSSCGGGVRV